MKPHHIILSSLIVAGLTACASTSDDKQKPRGIAAFANDARLGEQVDKICFNRNIDGFSDARRDTVVLTKGVSDYYIVEVSGVCSNLRYAQSIAVDSSLSCVMQGDSLLVSDSAFGLNDQTGMGPDRCFIEKIHRWDKDATNEENQDTSESE